MVIKIEKSEAVEILIKYLGDMFPNMLVVATEKYGDFEFSVLPKKIEGKLEEKKVE